MAIATGAAIALAAGAAASATGSAIQAHGASKAAKAQENASNRALDLQRQVYGDQMRMVNPYVQMGSDSLARLYSQHWGTPYQPQGGAGQPSMPGPGQAMPRGGMSLGQMGQMRSGGYGQAPAQMGQQQGPMMGGGGPQMGGGGGMVLRAPTTGETMQVDDPQEAQRLMSLGAERVQ